MLKCPACHKIKDKSMDLARHIVTPTGNNESDTKHKEWLEKQGLDLSKGWKPLAELLKSKVDK